MTDPFEIGLTMARDSASEAVAESYAAARVPALPEYAVDLSVPRTDPLELGLRLASRLPENTSAMAVPEMSLIVRKMATYIEHDYSLVNGRGMAMTRQEIIGMVTDALDFARDAE